MAWPDVSRTARSPAAFAFVLAAFVLLPAALAHAGPDAQGPARVGQVPGFAHSAPASLASIAPTPLAPYDAPDQPGTGDMQFVCARPADGRQGGNWGSANAIYGCPIRVYDFAPGGNTLSPFGNMRLTVREDKPEEAAIVTLHGSAANGPTNRSRDGNTHTVFTTPDMGITWLDSWTQGCPGGGWLGEGASSAMDSGGNLTIVYLWRGPGSLFHVYDMPAVTDDRSYMEHYCAGGEWAVESPGAVSAVHAVYVDAGKNATQPGWMALAWQDTDDIGRMHFAQRDEAGGDNAFPPWLKDPVNGTVPGCSGISNAVSWDSKVWVACVVGPGYTERRALPGEIDMWSYDPATGTAELTSFTGLRSPNPRLAVTDNGYMALFATDLKGTQQVDVTYAMGWHGKSWTTPRSMGAQLHAMLGSREMRDAYVTAVTLLDDTKTAYIVYEEWNKVQDNPLAGGVPGVPDPNDPSLPRLTDYKKVIVSLDECTAPIAASEMTMGYSPELVNQQDAWTQTRIFDDQYDGLQTVRVASGEEWVFFAVNDYGVAQFGAIRGWSGAGSQVCAITPPPPIPPVAVIPQGISVTTSASIAVGAVVGTAATAMVVYLLAAKRKVAQTVEAKDD